MMSNTFCIVTNPSKLREEVCLYMAKNSEVFLPAFQTAIEFQSFVKRMQKPNQWAEDSILLGCSLYLNRNIFLMSKENNKESPLTKYCLIDEINSNNLSQSIILGYFSQTHFQSMMPQSEKIVDVPSVSPLHIVKKNIPQVHPQYMISPKRQFTISDFIKTPSSPQKKKKKVARTNLSSRSGKQIYQLIVQ